LSTIAARPIRADARRNREKLLTAAGEAFAEAGFDAQVEDIARRAGVGVGTVYRHFPTKDALVDALAEAHFGHLADVVEAALGQDGDPWDNFVDTIWKAAAPAIADVASCEIIAGHPGGVDLAPLNRKRLEAASETLIARAKAAGSMRSDATVQDVRTIMCGFGHVAAAQRAGAALNWERYLTIALDGLRAR